MFLRQVYDTGLAQAAYMIGCQATGQALVIDPERDTDQYRRIARENDLEITAVAETHIHADFVSGARELAQDPNITLYLSSLGGDDWAYRWVGDRPNTVMLADGDEFMIGNIRLRAVHTPGHTPEHLSYLVTDEGGGADIPMAMSTGDFVFVGDVGRPDLLESAANIQGAMEPSARQLSESLREKLSDLPEFLQILPGHGAGSACGKALGAVPSSTLGYERRFNPSLTLANSDPDGFVKQILTGQPEPPRYFARMKIVNRDGIDITGGVPEVPHLEAKAFDEAASAEDTVVVDTRPDREAFLAERHPRSIHAPLKGTELTNAAGSLVTEKERILLVLDSVEHLDTARRLLYRIGLDNMVGYITFDELAASPEVRLVRLPWQPFQDFDARNLARDEGVLDVRRSDEFDSAHVEGAVHIPHTRLRLHLDKLDRSRRYYVYCRTGRRASMAASYLASAGYDVVLLNGDCAHCMLASQAD
ncbi:MAG: MBL fold metallo-hydrolase [Spirochaetaceae bacterium]